MGFPLIDHYTFQHFLFGVGVSLISVILLRYKYREFTVSLFVLILWELFEYRNDARFWIHSYANNLVDVVVGFIGILLGVFVIRTLTQSRSSRSNAREFN